MKEFQCSGLLSMKFFQLVIAVLHFIKRFSALADVQAAKLYHTRILKQYTITFLSKYRIYSKMIVLFLCTNTISSNTSFSE